MTDERYYLMSPYTSPNPAVMEARVAYVSVAAGILIQKGLIVFSPIVHGHGVARLTDLPKAEHYWRAYNETFMDWATAGILLRLPDYQSSRGIRYEVEYLERQNKPIRGVNFENIKDLALELRDGRKEM